MTNDISISWGYFYITLVCTAVFHKNRNSAWWLAAIASGMTIAGMFFPQSTAHITGTIVNRTMAIVVIAITAALVRHMREIQDRLAQQTERATELEQTKSEVFMNLGQELRVPLHSIIGISGLMMLDCRTDQKPPLMQVQNGGRRLLTTIENLIDLTHMDDFIIRPAPTELGKIVNQSIEAAKPMAEEHQVAIDAAQANPQTVMVWADAWSVRRILSNLIDNAIKFSSPGGTVTIVTETGIDTISVNVADTGIGMPPHVVRQLGQPFFQNSAGPGTGAGLALCRRLATAMNAELSFDSEPGLGTTAVLRLPVADQASR